MFTEITSLLVSCIPGRRCEWITLKESDGLYNNEGGHVTGLPGAGRVGKEGSLCFSVLLVVS